MIRKVIQIDEEKCNGCGLCANACHESAIGIVNGKAKLLRDDYCDGMGDCLPACPMNAISFIEREALEYDAKAVEENKKKKQVSLNKNVDKEFHASELMQWPCQIKLLPTRAPFFENCDLLIAADCTAYACADFHRDYMAGKVTLIGCPKLDDIDYSEKLTEICKLNNIKSITVTRMLVPCCGGLEWAVRNSIKDSGKNIPLRVVTLTTDGEVLKEEN